MLLTQQADGVCLPVDDQGKRVDDVAAEDAHIEARHIGEGGELAPEYDFATVVLRKAYLRLDDHRIGYAANTRQTVKSLNGNEAKRFPHVCAEHRPICSRIDQKTEIVPRTIVSEYFGDDHGPDQSVVA